MKHEGGDGVGRVCNPYITVRELYETEKTLRIKFEKPDRDTVIEAWIGLLMFIGVPFNIGYIMAARSPQW